MSNPEDIGTWPDQRAWALPTDPIPIRAIELALDVDLTTQEERDDEDAAWRYIEALDDPDTESDDHEGSNTDQ